MHQRRMFQDYAQLQAIMTRVIHQGESLHLFGKRTIIHRKQKILDSVNASRNQISDRAADSSWKSDLNPQINYERGTYDSSSPQV